MKLLIDNNLKYGNLLLIDSDHLVERYNRALEIICGKRTKLSEFHIDGGGYSPEIAVEFKDKNYLNPHGVNKKIIIVSMQQTNLPVLDAWFSATRDMINEFMVSNRDALFSLSSRDVVYGELENSTYKIKSFDDLLSIKNVNFIIDTPNNAITKARDLDSLSQTFQNSETAWEDEKIVNKIIELATIVGDIRQNPAVPTKLAFVQESFFTRHFGGIYVFRVNDEYTVIPLTDEGVEQAEKSMLDIKVIPISDRKAVIKFLTKNYIIESFSDRYLRDNIDVMREKVNFVVIDHMASKDKKRDLTNLSELDIKQFIYDEYDNLPNEFHALSKTVKLIDNGFSVDLNSIPEDMFFYFVRSSNNRLKALVNQLIAHYTPIDFLGVFIANKGLFYDMYDQFPDNKKIFVVEFIKQKYVNQEDHLKNRLYGDGSTPEPAIPSISNNDEDEDAIIQYYKDYANKHNNQYYKDPLDDTINSIKKHFDEYNEGPWSKNKGPWSKSKQSNKYKKNSFNDDGKNFWD